MSRRSLLQGGSLAIPPEKAAFGPFVAVTPPTGFTLTAPVPYTVYRTGLGRYVLDIDVDSLRPAAGVTYYIAPSGSSANTGLSTGVPIRLQDAIAKSDVGTIVCAPGEYFWSTHQPPTITKSLNIIAPSRQAILTGFKQPSAITWTLNSGSIYQAAQTLAQGVVDKRAAYATAAGFYPLYTQMADLASITGPGQWATDGTTLWVWALGNANLVTDSSFLRVSLDTASNGLRVSGANTLYIEGLQIEGSGSVANNIGCINAVNSGTAQPRLVVVDTTIRYSTKQGILATATAFSLFIRCTVNQTGADGIAYSAAAGLLPQAVELDCVTQSTGIFDLSQTGNGSTSHGGSKVLRINGTYRDSNGPTVDEDSGSLSWNLGCVAGSSRATTRFWAYCASSSGAQMWLEDCAADPGATALYAYDATSAIHVRRGRTGSLMRMSQVTPPVGTIDSY